MNDNCEILISFWHNQTPKIWQNFMKDLVSRGKIICSSDIAAELEKYNAVITPQQKISRKIIFNTPADRTMFLLRWS